MVPWLDYIDIDENTDERILKRNAPDEIKIAYKKYQKEIQEYIDNGMPIPK